MSSTTLTFNLSYLEPEHARLVFDAFSQWPTLTVRKKTPDAKRMKVIKASMEWIGYNLPRIYRHVFEEQTCTLEKLPIRNGNTVCLEFYCGTMSGDELFEAFFNEIVTIPVTIRGSLYRDLDGYTEKRTVTIS